MKNIIFHTVMASLTATILLAGPVQAQPLPHLALARLDVPVESPGIPYYVRLSRSGDGTSSSGWVVPANADWTAIVFYRDPDCIPMDFDLGFGIDPPGPDGLGAFACKPLFEGFDLRFSTLDPFLPPDYVFMRNSTADMPIWFVQSQEINELLDRGFVYLDEIEVLPSRVAGRAWQFEEQIRPFGPNPEATVRVTARGGLENGGQFSFFWFYRADVPDPTDLSSATELENVFELYADLPQQSPPSNPGPPNIICAIHPHLPPCNN
jgi:hypothetical protein